jgi:uncharacterized membrane protein
MGRTKLYAVIAATIALSARPVWAQGAFTPLGTKDTYVSGMSADGAVVVGVWGNQGPAWRWTAKSGVVDIGSVSQQVKVSRDGGTIVGTAKDAKGIAYAAIWQGGKQWVTLPPPANGRVQDGGVTSGWGVSANGSVIVGLAWVNPKGAEGFRYDANSGTVSLGSLKGKGSRASVVSGDGNVIAGWDAVEGSGPWYGAIWWQGLQRLMNPFAQIGQVEGINDSGSGIVGRGHPSNWRHAYRFTSSDGHVEDLGALPRGQSGIGIGGGPPEFEDMSIALAVSDDSTVVVGMSGYQPPTDAFIWTPETKMVKLSDYLTSKGITGHEQWTLLNANSISPDGKIIAGTGINNPAQRIEGFIVRLP